MASDVNRKAKRASVLLLATLLRKLNLLMQALERVLDLTGIGKKEGLKWMSNLIFSNGFQILAINFFQIVLKTCEVRFKWFKNGYFLQKITKIA